MTSPWLLNTKVKTLWASKANMIYYTTYVKVGKIGDYMLKSIKSFQEKDMW